MRPWRVFVAVSLLLLVGLIPCQAGETIALQNFTRSAHIPPTIAQRKPAGDRPIRYAVLQLSSSQRLACYSYWHTNRPHAEDFDYFTIDFWLVTLARRQKSHFRLLSSSYISPENKALSKGAHDFKFVWLDPVTRKTPVLICTATVTVPPYGSHGTWWVLVYRKGLKTAPSPQTFVFDQGVGSGVVDVLDIGIERTLDQNQHVQLWTSRFHPPDGDTVKTLWQWDGITFKAATEPPTSSSDSRQ